MSAIDLLWIVPLMLALLVLKGFFSGSEIALVNADRIKLSHRAKQGDRGAGVVIEFLKRPERLLATTLVGTNIATVSLTTLGTILCIDFFGDELGDLYAFILFTPLLLVLGEIVPKSVSQEKSDEIAPVAVFVLRYLSWVLSPIVVVFSAIARMAARMVGMPGSSQQLFVTSDQLRAVMQLAERAEGVEVFDRIRIERAIRFSDTTAGEAMTPVAEMIAIHADATMAEAVDLIHSRGYYRLPVYSSNMNDIVGVASISPWDLLDRDARARPLTAFVGPACYISPQESLAQLLPVLRARSDRMAIVVDEFGSAIGMLTLQDIFEAVVGDIEGGSFLDSARAVRREPQYQELEEDVFLMDARLPISELNDILGIQIPAREFHTVGGLVVARLGHLAREGETVVEAGYRFEVMEASDRRVGKVRVERQG